MLVINGIHLLENLKLEELVAKKVFEFPFIVQPLEIKRGSGSIVAPISVRRGSRLGEKGADKARPKRGERQPACDCDGIASAK